MTLRSVWLSDISKSQSSQRMYAIVSSVNVDGTIGIRRWSGATEETYPKLRSYDDATIGDRVLMLADETSWIVVGAIG